MLVWSKIYYRADIGGRDRAETNSAYIKYIHAASGAYVLDKQQEENINTSQACKGKVKGPL